MKHSDGIPGCEHSRIVHLVSLAGLSHVRARTLIGARHSCASERTAVIRPRHTCASSHAAGRSTAIYRYIDEGLVFRCLEGDDRRTQGSRTYMEALDGWPAGQGCGLTFGRHRDAHGAARARIAAIRRIAEKREAQGQESWRWRHLTTLCRLTRRHRRTLDAEGLP